MSPSACSDPTRHTTPEVGRVVPFRRTTDRNRSGRCCGWPPDPVVRVELKRDLLVRCEHTRQTLRVRENLFSSQCAAPRQSRRSNRNYLGRDRRRRQICTPPRERASGCKDVSPHRRAPGPRSSPHSFRGGCRMTDHDPPPPGAGQTPAGGPPPGWPPPGDAPEYRAGHAAAPGAAGGPAMAGGLGRQPPQHGIPWGRPLHKPGTVPLRPLTLGDFFDGAFTTIRRNPRATIGVAALVTAGVHGGPGRWSRSCSASTGQLDRARHRPVRLLAVRRRRRSPPPARSRRSSASWPASWSPAWSCPW